MRRSINFFGSIFLVSFLCFNGIIAKAGTTPPLIKVLDGSHGQVKKDSFVLVQNDVFFDTSYKKYIETPVTVRNTVTLQLNEAGKLYLKSPFQVTVAVRIVYTNSDGVIDSVNKNLTVSFDMSGRYNSRNSFVFNGGQRVKVTILSIKSSAIWDVTPALMVVNELEASPTFKFSCTGNAVQTIQYTAPSVAHPDELAVTWPNRIGADVYDLEWAYIDSSALANGVYGKPVNPSLLFANNATRITTSQLGYSVPLLYDNTGTLFFRVRAVQERNDGTRLESAWSSDYPASGLGQFNFSGHERLLNWQSTATYAEDGKRKVVVQYYDGSLRARQTVTKDNSTNTTVVAETFYDKQGRPAIQVLPSPTLNSIIQYSQNFNIGLNGGEYDKNNYDTLISASAFCGTGATTMATTGGASNYYSPSNPKKNEGNQQYIPDAKGFPFTETEYTQDNTGRIKRQGGAGPDHQLGSGHETLYYYGSPDQAELDALFGTEAGDKSHYFKNMVRDANGQYSVSYADMHGRTVATALAGLPPADIHLDVLDSYKADNVTESLADSGAAVIKDLVTTHTKSLLVTTRDTFKFNYAFDPATLIKAGCTGDSVHYHCLYNLEIKITDDCNNQKLPGQQAFDTTINNFTVGAVDTTLGNTKGFHINFSLDLPEGSYEITKKLSVSPYVLQYYRDSIFLRKNTCSTLTQWIQTQRNLVMNNQCHPDCQSCLDSLGSWDSFRVRYMKMGGITAADTAANRSNAWAAYQSALAACNALCDSAVNRDDIRSAMLSDVSAPSGQYANPNIIDKYSIFYTESSKQLPIFRLPSLVYLDMEGHPEIIFDDSTGANVLPQKLDAAQFAAKFKSSWAATLLPFHPEYCKLAEYEKHTASNQWDAQFTKVDDYATALAKGYLNPTANTTTAPFNLFTADINNKDPLSAESSDYKNRLETKLINYTKLNGSFVSMWSLATLQTVCDSGGTTCFNQYKSDATAFNNSMCTGDKDMAWRYFRQLYLESKKSILNDIVNGATCANGASKAAAADLAEAGHQPNFNNASDALSQNGLGYMAGLDIAKAKDSARAAMGSYYCATCSSYIKLWKQQLSSCYSNDVLDNIIIPRLLQVCIKGSDANHPNGSSDISPDSAYTYKSFAAIIDSYNRSNNITDVLHCNADVLTTPGSYNQHTVYSAKPVWTKPSDCECATINSLYQEYQRYGTVDNSFSAFLLRTRNTKMSESDLTQLRNSCNNGNLTCKYLSKPINLPPALQCYTGNVCATCSQVDSLYHVYLSTYPGNEPSKMVTDTIQQAKNLFFANYLNNRLGYTKQAFEYLDFMAQCDSASVADTTVGTKEVVAASYQPATITTCFSAAHNTAYNVEGAFIYSNTQDTVGVEIEDNTGFWRNDPTGKNSSDTVDGRLNRVGIWLCDSTKGNPYYKWEGFTVPVYIPATDTVFVGMSGDNKIRVTIDGQLFKSQDQYPWHSGGVTTNDATPFLRWHIYPVYLSKGYHNFTVEGLNDEIAASFGAEVYYTTRDQLLTADSNTVKGFTLFSTAQVAKHQAFPAGHSCPVGYRMDSTGGNYTCEFTPTVCKDTLPVLYHTATFNSCFSPVKDAAYSLEGAYIYSSAQDTVGLKVPDTNSLWANTTDGTTNGYLNRVGVWACDSVNSTPYRQWIGFTMPVEIPRDGVYYMGMAADNQLKITIDGLPFKEIDQQPWHTIDGDKDKDSHAYLRWFIYPVTLLKGTHDFTIQGWNTAHNASFGAEIYDATREQLIAADSNSIKKYILFSTAQIAQHQVFKPSYGCPASYSLDSSNGNYFCSKTAPCTCKDIIPATHQTITLSSCFSDVKDAAYSAQGTNLYNSVQDTVGISLSDNPFWSNTTNGTTDGYLNRVGVWSCANDSLPLQQWVGFTVPVSIPATGIYYIGMASDNQERIFVDGRLFKELDQQPWNTNNGNKDKDANPFLKWHIYPVTLIKGYHNLTVEAWNTALKGSFGAEVYSATRSQLMNADSNSIKNYLLFSTTQVGQHQTFNAGYSCPSNYTLDSSGGNYTCREVIPCNSLSYSGLHLCGSSDPIFPAVVVDSVSSCSDSSFFAVSKGTELFSVYSDSLKGSFETDYRNLCLQAYRHESFTVSHANSEYHYTLYYYDQAGNLVKTVPPQGVAVNRRQSWLDSVSQARATHTDLPNIQHSLVTQYRYNTLNQVTAQHTPDAGSSRYWYDRLGRLVLSQNAKQLPTSDYSYTLYDAIGRITEVGQINNVQAMDDSISRVPERLKTWINNVVTTKNQITQTVYDVSYRPIDSVGLFHAVNLRNRVAYTSFYPTYNDMYPGGQQSATYYSYDIHGNVDTLLQDYKGLTTMNKANRFKRMVYQYDLVSGKANSVAYQPNQPDAFYHRYSYDAENRITNVETSHDSLYWENEAYYEYYKHGPLARTITGQQQVQGTDYVYTLHGWLKAVNPMGNSTDGTAGSMVAADAYRYHLNYYGNDYTGIAAPSPSVNVAAQLAADYRPLYNGNISSMAVNIGKLQNPLLYNYRYDQLNRLTAMDAWKADSSFSTLAKISDFAEKISYDANGNILQYQRNGNHTFAGKALGMDSLTYNYQSGTNKLDHINDAVRANNYTEDIDDQSTGNYNYDAIGNLVKDDAGGISNINWTVYGKIDSITKTNGATIKYLYDAAGNRISKTVKQGGITSTTGYVRDASGNVMSVYTATDTTNSGHLMQSEVDLYGSSRLGIWKPGIDVDYLTPATDTIVPLLGTGYSLTFTRGNKLFELNNHLGNVLATLSDKKLQHTSDSATVDYYKPDVVSAGDYYPFGMGMPGRSYTSGGSYRYGFNGKEKDPDMDGNVYDYGFRIYNPQIGRFLSTDPLTKKYPYLTPYSFAENDVIRSIDLDGNEKLIAIVSNYNKGDAQLQLITDKDAIKSIWKLFSGATSIGDRKIVWNDDNKISVFHDASSARYRWYAEGAKTSSVYPSSLEGAGILSIDLRGKSAELSYYDWSIDYSKKVEDANNKRDEQINVVIDKTLTVASLFIGLGELKGGISLLKVASLAATVDDLTEASKNIDNKAIKNTIEHLKLAISVANIKKTVEEIPNMTTSVKAKSIFTSALDAKAVLSTLKADIKKINELKAKNK